MSIKYVRKSAILFIGAIVMAFGLLPARLSAQVLTVPASGTTMVAAGDAACITQVTVNNNNGQGVEGHQGCSGNRATTTLTAGTLFPNTVDVTFSTRFVKQFQVKAVQGAATTSFVPILIAVPVMWQGTLFNDSLVPPIGPLDSVGAHVDVNMFLRVTQGDPQAPIPTRTNVTENRFNAASHAGVGGCLSVPTDGVSAVVTAATCAVAVIQSNQGTATVFLSTIVETGKTYNIELELLTDLFAFDTSDILTPAQGSAHPVANFEQNPVTSQPPFGLTWNGPMSITVGTDFQSNIQALQDEITQLRADLNTLRQEFKTHRHVYLTGKGVGQNNTRADTSTPLFQ